MLKPALQVAIGQQLAMTPQLQQAIRLLQLSAQELELEIHTALESNAMLEAEGDPAWGDADTDADSDSDTGSRPAQPVDTEAETGFDETGDIQYMSTGRGRAAPDQTGERELQAVEQNPLREHLLWQLEMGTLGSADLAIGVALIDALDDDGYLTENLEAIRQSLEPDLSVELDEVEAILHHVQMLDPIGVGARDLSECLRLQLQQFDPSTPGLVLARQLPEGHLEALAAGDFAEIGRRLNADSDSVREAAERVRALNPRPGSALAAVPAEYIVPDVVVERHDGRWQVRLNPVVAPRLRVNGYYASLLRTDGGLQDNNMLRTDLREARWLIRSLEMRHQTLLKVATALVERQQAYLERGEEYMRPLILRDIAAEIDVHESTVSRVTANKFMQTPRGVIGFKYFFSTPLTCNNGAQQSATAIRALIKKMIAAEDVGQPLSDGKIVERLGDRDIQVARRTVAKYREALGIPAKATRRRDGIGYRPFNNGMKAQGEEAHA